MADSNSWDFSGLSDIFNNDFVRTGLGAALGYGADKAMGGDGWMGGLAGGFGGYNYKSGNNFDVSTWGDKISNMFSDDNGLGGYTPVPQNANALDLSFKPNMQQDGYSYGVAPTANEAIANSALGGYNPFSTPTTDSTDTSSWWNTTKDVVKDFTARDSNGRSALSDLLDVGKFGYGLYQGNISNKNAKNQAALQEKVTNANIDQMRKNYEIEVKRLEDRGLDRASAERIASDNNQARIQAANISAAPAYAQINRDKEKSRKTIAV